MSQDDGAPEPRGEADVEDKRCVLGRGQEGSKSIKSRANASREDRGTDKASGVCVVSSQPIPRGHERGRERVEGASRGSQAAEETGK